METKIFILFLVFNNLELKLNKMKRLKLIVCKPNIFLVCAGHCPREKQPSRTIVDAFTVRCKARADDTYVAQNTWLGKTIRKSYQLALIFQTAVLFPFQGKVKQAL